MTDNPRITLPLIVETEHLETWRHLYLRHYPSPDDPGRCNEPSCGRPAPCWYWTHSRASLIRVGQPLPTPTDVGHPDYPKEDPMGPEWKRSSKCDNSSGNCVEVAFLDDGVVAVRDSTDPTAIQHYLATEWDAFTDGVKNGEFNRI